MQKGYKRFQETPVPALWPQRVHRDVSRSAAGLEDLEPFHHFNEATSTADGSPKMKVPSIVPKDVVARAYYTTKRLLTTTRIGIVMSTIPTIIQTTIPQ